MKNGPIGIFSGRVGNIIGYNYRGNQVIRSIPKRSTKPPTVAQLAQRMRFGLAVHFITPLKRLTSKGYGNKQGTKSPSAQCIAYHSKYAVKGTYPDLEIDYNEVVLTTGRLLGANDGEVFSNCTACINFSWIESMRWGVDCATDEAVLVVYNPSKDRHEFTRTSSNRASQCATLNVPTEFSGDTVHCWLIFISTNGKEFSTSSYLGTVTVA